jgi:hypothetical protein
MGLFDDARFDPNTYASGAPSWLDNLMQQAGVQPSAGFPALPQNANAAMPTPAAPQPQNSPMPIGDYSMPRVGSGFALPDGELDTETGEHVAPAPAAAPMQQAAAPVQQPAPQPQNAWSTFFNKAADGLDSVAHGGSLLGVIRGQPTDARSVQLRQTQQLSAALAGAGIPQQQAQQFAMIHAIDPEAGRALIQKALGPPQTAPEYGWDPQTRKAVHLYTPEQKDNFQVVQTGENGLGGKSFSKMNKADGTMTPIASAAGADNGGGLGNMDLTGDAYLASMPKSEANIVRMMAEGTQTPPSSFALGKQLWVNRIAAAKNYDPTFDGANWSGRVAGVKDFSAGKSSEMVRSANQTLAHVNSLLDSADALHNGSYPIMNWAGNKLNEATGGGEPGAFRTNAHAVAEEMSKVFKGANMSDSEIHAWEDNLSENMSPAQQRAQIGKLSELLHGSLQALEEKRLNSIGPMAAEKQGPLIKPEGQAVLKRIDAWLKAGNGNAAGASGTAPTGVKWSVVQ